MLLFFFKYLKKYLFVFKTKQKASLFVIIIEQTQIKVIMEKYICIVCDYIYDPEKGDPDSGIEPGTAWEDVPADWVCPLCGVGKEEFEKAS